MACYCNILLCYDSTREGRRALIQGAELAQQLGAETHLLAIVPSNDGSMSIRRKPECASKSGRSRRCCAKAWSACAPAA
jgi:hypothetical protein